jgi:hypothetical protein
MAGFAEIERRKAEVAERVARLAADVPALEQERARLSINVSARSRP